MPKLRSVPVIAALLTVIVGTVTATARAQAPAAPPTPTTSPGSALFDFHSALWVNLHHFLYVIARQRLHLDPPRPAVTAALADTVGYGALRDEQRAAWERAVSYYEQTLGKQDILFDSSMVVVTTALVWLGDDASSVRDAGLDSGLANALAEAAPVYRALWWPRHNAANQRWITATRALLAEHGDSAARLESRIFQRPWAPTPVRVDICAYTNWTGAYTTVGPPHMNMSSLSPGNRGTRGFETLFHEVLHTMDDSVSTAIQEAFDAAGKRFVRDPTHPFIFYTAGAVTATLFPGHVPYAEATGLWARNPDYERILPLLRQHWQAYIDGSLTLAEAMRRIAQAW